MQFLVLQHMNIEHPGIFRDFMAADGITWDVAELDEGAALPDPAAYDAVIAMGGPMDTWQEDQHPWMAAEKAYIRETVEARIPFLGFCLGHQLLAEAMGGTVGPADTPEVGILDVELTDTGRRSVLFRGMPAISTCLQWHGAEVTQVPPGAEVLARSPLCGVQALGLGGRAFSIQFHVELTAETVPGWAKVPEYANSLESALGEGALERMIAEADQNMEAFNATARALYDNFLGVVHTASAEAA